MAPSFVGFLQRTRTRLHILSRGLFSPRYRPTDFTQSEWNDQYRSGCWADLGSLKESARFGVVAAYRNRVSPQGSVLDIGCGVGTLRPLLGECSRYVGIDLSADAIASASLARWPDANFAVADAQAYSPAGKFSLIIFNEVLYYLPDPVAVVSRYLEFLEEEGFFIVSMYDQYDPRLLWSALGKRFQQLDGVILHNSSGLQWQIRLYSANSVVNRSNG
jgi:SAM-dependent methyltransferase